MPGEILRTDFILQPPHDNEIEQALLGALIADPRGFDGVTDLIDPDDFYAPVHGRIFTAIGKAFETNAPMVPTLRRLFESDEELTSVGGGGYIADLVDSLVSIKEAPNYARHIHDLAVRRKLLEIGQDIAADALVEDLERSSVVRLEAAEQRLFELAEKRDGGAVVGMETAMDGALERIQAAQSGIGITGVTTGLSALDERLGGLHPGMLYVAAGRPGMGKTDLALSVAFNAANAGHPTLMFSLEMPTEQLAQRILARLTGISTQQQTRLGAIDSARFRDLLAARTKLISLPFFMDDAPALKLAQIRARARRFKRRKGLGLLVIDYLQLIKSADARMQMVHQIQEITTGLKALAKELNVPILLLSQLNREVEKRDDKRPLMADLRDSGSIEQDADVVMFVYREAEYLKRKEPRNDVGKIADWHAEMERAKYAAEVITAKHRHGETGTDKLRFDGARHLFEDGER